MKKLFTKQILLLLVLVVGFVFVVQVGQVHAEEGTGVLSKFLAFTSFPDLVNSLLANLANAALFLASYVLIAAAHVLDVSIRLTLNMKDFVNATPAIYTVWKVLRDITGLFFIFYLLYAAIQMMTGLGKGSYGSTIKNIVIAGILINFSFFIVSVAIDFSNITSQAVYNAMVPNSQVVKINSTTGLKELVERGGKSDISNIFMNSLRIQSIYDVQGNKLGTNIKDPIKIVLIGFTGVVMMITTAASFIFASIAFIARLVILLFVLAFSSIWFAGMVIPEIRKSLEPIKNALVSQLIFMPVYLLLMYVALTIINGSQLFTAGNIGGVASTITGPNWIMPYIILAVNFAIIIFILNTPLAVGLSMGGMATSWMKKGMGKWDAMNVWKNVGLWSKDRSISGAGAAWKNTGGRAASAFSRSEGLKDFAAKSVVGGLALKGIRGVAGSYDKKLESQVKARTEFAESLGYNKSAVSSWDAKIRKLNREMSLLPLDPKTDTAAQKAERARLKADIESAKRVSGQIKDSRKEDYMKRIDSEGVETLWSKVARKDKKAAAKIQVELYQSDLKDKKESIKEIRSDIKQLQNAIRNNPATGTTAAGTATSAQQTELDRLVTKQNEAQTKIDTIEDNLALEELDANR